MLQRVWIQVLSAAPEIHLSKDQWEIHWSFCYQNNLRAGAKYGCELKAGFEALFRGLWYVNVGQIYSTLSRGQRDRLVINERVVQDDRPDKKVYKMTELGELEID